MLVLKTRYCTHGIQSLTDRYGNTYPTLNQKTNSERYVSKLDAEMIQHTASRLSVHTAPLIVVANQHVSLELDFHERRIVIVFHQYNHLFVGQSVLTSIVQECFFVQELLFIHTPVHAIFPIAHLETSQDWDNNIGGLPFHH